MKNFLINLRDKLMEMPMPTLGELWFGLFTLAVGFAFAALVIDHFFGE